MAEQTSEDHSSVYRVMVCVDDSHNARNAFDYYMEQIHKPENEVLVLHVSDQIKIPTYALFSGVTAGAQSFGPWLGKEGLGFSQEEMNSRVRDLQRKNDELKQKYDVICQEKKVKHKVLIVSEDPDGDGAAIVTQATKNKINLIVMGSRGLGTLRRTFMGSVSDYVMHHSHIPTLIVPPPKK